MVSLLQRLLAATILAGLVWSAEEVGSVVRSVLLHKFRAGVPVHTESMTQVRNAVVLAAGKGTRMGSLTAHLPKPLLPVGPKPLLEHILDGLREAGIERAAVVIGYRGEMIQQHFAQYPMPIAWFSQQELNGTAQALGLTRDFVGDEPFLLTFGDIWCEVADYRGMIGRLVAEPQPEAILGARWVDDPWQGAAIYVDRQEYVTSIVEKPPKGTSKTNWNSAGIYVFRQSIMDELAQVPLSPRGEYEITTAIQQLIARGCKLRSYAVSDKWHDVGRPEDLRLLSRELGYQAGLG